MNEVLEAAARCCISPLAGKGDSADFHVGLAGSPWSVDRPSALASRHLLGLQMSGDVVLGRARPSTEC